MTETRTLETIASAFASAIAGISSHAVHEPVARLLDDVREHMTMDVVFVSRFMDARRVFQVVSASGAPHPHLTPGNSDPELDTYCHAVITGALPRVIRDTASHPHAAALPITAHLSIGAYLSAPVILPDGTVYGTVCCVSHSTRPDLRESDAEGLQAVADLIATLVRNDGNVAGGPALFSGR